MLQRRKLRNQGILSFLPSTKIANLEPSSRHGDTSRPKSGTIVSKNFLKSLEQTDSGSLAGSESVGGTRARPTVTARTTASHNIASTKAGNLTSKKKNKGKASKGKQKETVPEPDTQPEPEAQASLSDDDDSQEREAALSSPIKGKTSRELNKVS